MIKHLLFDLDGTLLPVDVDFFFQDYLSALSPQMAHLISEKSFTNYLMASTMEMTQNNGTATNEEVFWRDFTIRTGYTREVLEPIFYHFYEHEFPKLKEAIPPARPVREILETSLKKGFSLIIATNPVFPLSAIIERLAWIDCHHLPYTLITSVERMHFCKPNPRYYQEILDLLDLNEKECLMIGNDVEEDLIASSVGIKTCLVTDFLISRGKLEVKPDYRCKIEDLKAVIEGLNS